MPYFAAVSRIVLASTAVVALFAGIALLFVWYVSFGMGQPAAGEIAVASIRQSTRLSYSSDGAVSVSAVSEADAYTALGYQAARDHGWTIVLLRQAATGRLGEWFGEPAFELDRFARSLAFSSSAIGAVDNLDQEDTEILQAYARGVSAGFDDPGVALGNEFVLFDIKPEPWEAWHSVAIEKMIAWMSEPPMRADPSDSLFNAIRRFEERDVRFRSFLHLHGFEMSAAWTHTDSSGSWFSSRLVYGASALPLFTPVNLTWSPVSVSGIVLLGTPFMPILSGNAGVRVTMLSSDRLMLSTSRVNSGATMSRRRGVSVASRMRSLSCR